MLCFYEVLKDFICILEMLLLSVRLNAHWQQVVVLQAPKHYCHFPIFLHLCQNLLFLLYCLFVNKSMISLGFFFFLLNALVHNILLADVALLST